MSKIDVHQTSQPLRLIHDRLQELAAGRRVRRWAIFKKRGAGAGDGRQRSAPVIVDLCL